MRILVVEYMSAGGVYNPHLPTAIATEGLAMLQAALADLTALPDVEAATLLDGRLTLPPVPAQVDFVGPGQFAARFRSRLDWAEAALVIAPENGEILADLSREVERSGKLLLGSSPEGAMIAGDKLLTAERLRAHHVPTPPVAPVPAGRPGLPEGWRYPVVVKPRDGCGCDGVRLVRRTSQLARAVSGGGQFLVQPFQQGMAVSVSLLVAGGKAMPLSLNSQEIYRRDGQFVYRGGRTGITHYMQMYAFEVAQAAVLAVPGLRGYIGVDLVLTGKEPQVIEINPRLTTAYTGLRLGCSINLMGAILEACTAGRLPAGPVQVRSVSFGKAGPIEGVAAW